MLVALLISGWCRHASNLAHGSLLDPLPDILNTRPCLAVKLRLLNSGSACALGSITRFVELSFQIIFQNTLYIITVRRSVTVMYENVE